MRRNASSSDGRIWRGSLRSMKNDTVIGWMPAGTAAFSAASADRPRRKNDATKRTGGRKRATLRADLSTATLPRRSASVREFDEGLLRYVDIRIGGPPGS